MFFKKNKKVLFFVGFVVLITLLIIFSGDLAEAATVKVTFDDPRIRICYDIKTGNYESTFEGPDRSCGTGNGRDTLRYIDGKHAYCVNWPIEYGSDNYYVDTSWIPNSKNAIMAGYIINYVNSQNFDKPKAFARTGATLNTFFATSLNDSGSYDFSVSSEIIDYINRAKSYYETVKLEKKLPNISIEESNLSYNEGIKKYFSDKITVSGLVKTYGGSNDIVTYSITAKTSGGKEVNICTDSKGTNCKSTVSLSGQSTNYSFYLFADENKVDTGDTIEVKVTGSNSSSYYSSVLYKNVEEPDNVQKLLVIDEINIPRTVSKNYVLTVPNLTNHTINAYKVDENGEEICGATLEIYRDDPKGENDSNRLATNKDDDDNNDCRITYISDTLIEQDDDFYNHDYYLIERSAPDGFVLSDEIRHFKPENKLSLVCYETVDGELKEVDDMEFCYPEKYDYMCKNNNNPTDIKDDENGNCLVSEAGGDVSTNANTDDGVGVNSIYTKVCYNIEDENNLKEANDAYCIKDKNYTKIWNGYGNVTVRQLNVRNVINISKVDITNKEEVIGAKLKICTKNSYDVDGNNCEVATTRDGVKLSWISNDVPYSIYGIKVGEYYIIEEIPPKGYIKATTAIKFSVDKYGKVVTDNKTITNNDFVNNGGVIVVDNNITNITISKRDIATKKELPGAVLSICESYRDENNELQMKVDQYTGDCIETVLYNGEIATWKSTDSAKKISGLNPGTYYLVEKIAPDNYNLAESILFTLNNDGSLVDKDGKSLKDNKLVMFDEIIEDKKTGTLSLYVVMGMIIGTGILGLGTYYYLKKNKGVTN